MDDHSQLIGLEVNGTSHDVVLDPRTSLADALRHHVGLTGTHVGCEHGVCGSCTVLIDGQPARSCLTLAVSTEGSTIRTVEDLGAPDRLSDLQESFTRHHALQCGFCTPGFLMLIQGAMDAGMLDDPAFSREQARELVASNLCRCTGYEPIVDVVCELAERRRAETTTPSPTAETEEKA